MDKIPVISDIEYAKYLLVCVGIINALSAYIFTSFKKTVEARLKKLEKRSDSDHDVLIQVQSEHKMNHPKND